MTKVRTKTKEYGTVDAETVVTITLAARICEVTQPTIRAWIRGSGRGSREALPTFNMLDGRYMTTDVLLEWLRNSEDLHDPRSGDPLGNLEKFLGIESKPQLSIRAAEYIQLQELLEKVKEKNPDFSAAQLQELLDTQ